MKARKVKGLEPEASLAENARRIIRTRLAELRAFSPAALEGDATEQHDMRIAAKRLRYVLEITGGCFGDPAGKARRRARDLQEVLGELHDCDVMLPRVHEHEAALRTGDAQALRARAGAVPDLDPRLIASAPDVDSSRGLGLLAVHLEARRSLLFDRFVELWGELERERVWDQLGRALDERQA